MAIWKDRVTGRSEPRPSTANIPGRWALEANGGSAQINSQPLLNGGAYFLVPDRRQNWSVDHDDGLAKDAGHFGRCPELSCRFEPVVMKIMLLS